MKMKGSQIIIECLKEQGVDTVFGCSGELPEGNRRDGDSYI